MGLVAKLSAKFVANSTDSLIERSDNRSHLKSSVANMEDKNFNIPAFAFIHAMRRNDVDHFVTVSSGAQSSLMKLLDQ